MKIVEIPRITRSEFICSAWHEYHYVSEVVDDLDAGAEEIYQANGVVDWKYNTACYILTALASMSAGCVVAEWSRRTRSVNWQYSCKPCFAIMPEDVQGELLVQNDISSFRMILSTLGIITIDDCYFGAGTFRVRYKNDVVESESLAIVLSNTREMGYWIRLQVLTKE